LKNIDLAALGYQNVVTMAGEGALHLVYKKK
jgi:hypothetical protein